MRKLLIGLILVVVIALAGATYILPTYISNQISGRIERSLQTDSVSANIETSPSFMMLFGQVDNIDIEATNIKLDKVNGVFDIVNKSTDAISMISDKIVNGTMTLVSKIFKNKKREDDFDE